MIKKMGLSRGIAAVGFLVMHSSVYAGETAKLHQYYTLFPDLYGEYTPDQSKYVVTDIVSISKIFHYPGDLKIIGLVSNELSGLGSSLGTNLGHDAPIYVRFPSVEDASRARLYLEYIGTSLNLTSNVTKTEYYVKRPIVAIYSQDILVTDPVTLTKESLQDISVRVGKEIEEFDRHFENRKTSVSAFQSFKNSCASWCSSVCLSWKERWRKNWKRQPKPVVQYPETSNVEIQTTSLIGTDSGSRLNSLTNSCVTPPNSENSDNRSSNLEEENHLSVANHRTSPSHESIGIYSIWSSINLERKSDSFNSILDCYELGRNGKSESYD